MEWQILLVLGLMMLVVLFTVAFLWSANTSGLWVATKEALQQQASLHQRIKALAEAGQRGIARARLQEPVERHLNETLAGRRLRKQMERGD